MTYFFKKIVCSMGSRTQGCKMEGQTNPMVYENWSAKL